MHAYGNYAPTRSPNALKPFNAWTVAALAYLLGTGIVAGLGFVLGFAGLVLAFVMGFADIGDGLTERNLVVVVVLVAVGLTVLGVAVQASFIRRRGGARPLAAPATAVAISWLVGLLAGQVSVPTALLIVLQAAVEIVVLATMIRRRR